MGEKTKISWTDSTFNPWRGCLRVSPGCDRCYASALSKRVGWRDQAGCDLWDAHAERVRASAAYWRNPVRWQASAASFQRKHGRRRRVFCASLADVFDNQAPAAWRVDLFELIRRCPDLDWQILTKRPQNIARFLPPDWGDGYPNVWLGVTTESQEYYDQRWPVLARTPAVIRFVSYEPAIGPLRIASATDLDWLICGGESGGKARVMQPQWVRDIRDDCARLGLPFFLKQFGSYASNPLVVERGLALREARNLDPDDAGKGGARLDGVLYRAFPAGPRTAAGGGSALEIARR